MQTGFLLKRIRESRVAGVQPTPSQADGQFRQLTWVEPASIREKLANTQERPRHGAEVFGLNFRTVRAKRARGFEPLTFCLEGRYSTTELRPRLAGIVPHPRPGRQAKRRTERGRPWPPWYRFPEAGFSTVSDRTASSGRRKHTGRRASHGEARLIWPVWQVLPPNHRTWLRPLTKNSNRGTSGNGRDESVLATSSLDRLRSPFEHPAKCLVPKWTGTPSNSKE